MGMVFADAGFWIARRDKRDEHHLQAVRLTEALMAERAQLVVTPFIFAEAQAYFSRSRILRELVIRDCWRNAIVRVEPATHDDQESAVEILLTHKDKAFSFCDALSFVVMDRLRIARVVTFDDHFRQFGAFQIFH